MAQPAFHGSTQSRSSFPTTTQTTWQGIRRMLAVWFVFGSFVGGTSGPGRDLIGILSGALAGVIVIAWLGALLGLIGEARITFFAGLFGALVGLLYGVLSGGAGVLYNMNLALIIGAIVGATFPALLSRLLRRLPRPTAITN